MRIGFKLKVPIFLSPAEGPFARALGQTLQGCTVRAPSFSTIDHQTSLILTHRSQTYLHTGLPYLDHPCLLYSTPEQFNRPQPHQNQTKPNPKLILQGRNSYQSPLRDATAPNLSTIEGGGAWCSGPFPLSLQQTHQAVRIFFPARSPLSCMI